MGRIIMNHASFQVGWHKRHHSAVRWEMQFFHTLLIDCPVLRWSIDEKSSETIDRDFLRAQFLEINALHMIEIDSSNPCLILWMPLSSSYFHFKIPAKSNNRETVLNWCKIHILRDERVVWIFRSIVRQVCPEDREWTPVELNSLWSVDHVDVDRKLMCLSKGLLKKKL